MKRNAVIDICKGVGILLVIIGHAQTPLSRVIYGFHMALFFFLSGYCFSNKYVKTWKTILLFLKNRFIRLLIPFFLFPAIAFFIIPHAPVSVTEMYGSVMETYPSNIFGTFWFLRALFFVCILSAISIKVMTRLPKDYAILTLLMASLLGAHLSYWLNIGLSRYVYYSFFYITGYGIKSKEKTLSNMIKKDIKYLLLLILCLIVLIIISYKIPIIIQHTSPSTYIIYALGAFCGIFFTYQMCRLIWVHNDMPKGFLGWAFSTIGKHTMAIMLFNWASFGVIDILMTYLDINIEPDGIYQFLKIISAIFIPIALSMCYDQIKKKCKLYILIIRRNQ